MDKKQLSQFGYLKGEIESIKEQIGALQPNMTTDSVTGSYTEFPYVKHTIKIRGVDMQDYDQKVGRLERKLQKRMNELIDLKEEINEYITTIDDSEMRQILTLRYINGMTWQQIAEKLGYQDESAPRKRHDRFLR